MRIAIQCFGGIRCGIEHKHIENFISQFTEIFNENNEIDFFILSTKTEFRGKPTDAIKNTNYLKELLGNKIKIFEYIEDQPDIIEREKQIINKWNNLPTNVLLSLDELKQYRQVILYGIELRTAKNLWVPSLLEELEKVDQAIKTNQTITLTKDNFVPLLYYRRMINNNMRKKYEIENNIKYDWVISGRLFDTIFTKLREFTFLYNPPIKNTVYCSIDNLTMSTPEISNIIYDNLGNYPVIGYEQWNDEEFKKEYLKVDIGIYFLRTCATLCSENQMMWACLKSCENCIQLRFDNDEPDKYLKFQTCPNRW